MNIHIYHVALCLALLDSVEKHHIIIADEKLLRNKVPTPHSALLAASIKLFMHKVNRFYFTALFRFPLFFLNLLFLIKDSHLPLIMST